jgi:ABC-type Zn uptake system ZnuABC Zn-binding protein ZnuA
LFQLQKDFEQDKQQAVSRAINNIQRETDRLRKKTEEEIRAKYMEEMKKLAQKHKEQISTTKKKQWVGMVQVGGYSWVGKLQK